MHFKNKFASLLLFGAPAALASDLSPAEQRVLAWIKEIRARSPRCDSAFQSRIGQANAKALGGEKGFEEEADISKLLNLLGGGPKIPPATAAQFADFVLAKSNELKDPALLDEFGRIHCLGFETMKVLNRMLFDAYGLLPKRAALVRQVATRVREEVTESSGHFDLMTIMLQVGLMQTAVRQGLFKAPDRAVKEMAELRQRVSSDYQRLHEQTQRQLKAKNIPALLKADLDMIRAARGARREFEKILASLG